MHLVDDQELPEQRGGPQVCVPDTQGRILGGMPRETPSFSAAAPRARGRDEVVLVGESLAHQLLQRAEGEPGDEAELARRVADLQDGERLELELPERASR